MTTRYRETIAAFPMFQGYTSYGLDVLLERGAITELAGGQMLYTEGEPASFVALVVAGQIDLYIDGKGQEQQLPSAGPSRLLGELAALAGATRVMSARAAEPSVILKWNADAFRRLLSGDAELSQRIFRETFRSIVDERQSLISSLQAARTGTPG
jgi:CRP/FNR family transcriptional activator FtrB